MLGKWSGSSVRRVISDYWWTGSSVHCVELIEKCIRVPVELCVLFSSASLIPPVRYANGVAPHSLGVYGGRSSGDLTCRVLEISVRFAGTLPETRRAAARAQLACAARDLAR